VVHVALALSLVTFCLGVVAVALGLYTWVQRHAVVFRQLALVFAAALALLAVPLLKLYEIATTADFGVVARSLYGLLYAVGYGLFIFIVPRLVFTVCALASSARRRVVLASASVVAAGLGAWHGVDPGPVPDAFANAALLSVQIYAVVILVPWLPRVTDPLLRSLLRRLCGVVVIGGAVAVAQYVLTDLVPFRSEVRDIPLAQILYFVLNSAALLAFALRSSPARASGGAATVSESFVQRYGISPREKEIIELIVNGHSNRMIAERLFISAMTVKNHIYHIYQKTGAENKIQLRNLIEESK